MFTKEDCSKNLQIENRSSSCQRWSLHGFQTSHFICNWFDCKVVSANFGCNQFRIMPDIVSKLLRAAIWSCCAQCAVLFESEQSPFPGQWTGYRLISAALHRIQSWTSCFVPMSYFYSETIEWLKYWAKQWALLCSATTSRQFHPNFHFTWKTKVTRCSSISTMHQNLFESQTESLSQKW